MDGTNGGTSFGDQSAVIKGSGSAQVFTLIGNTNTSTAQSKFYGSSGYFDGSGDGMYSSSTSALDVSTGDWTIECWSFLTTTSGTQMVVGYNNTSASDFWDFTIVSGVPTFKRRISGVEVSVSGGAVTAQTWTHLAISRSGTQITLYVNGVNVASNASVSMPTSMSDLVLGIGYNRFGGGYEYYYNGYIQDLRIYKGVTKYTGDFIVPTPNSFQLKFADNSSNTAATLGKDTSGNSNNWTPNNLSVTAGAGNDSLVDTPTSIPATDTGVGGEVRGNYCTANPLDNLATLSNGNLQVTSPSTSYVNARGTIALPATDKWYAEATVISNTGPSSVVTFGLAKKSASLSSGYGTSSNIYALVVGSQFTIYNSTTVVIDVAGTLLAGDVMQIAYDAATGKGWVGVNNTWRNSTGGTTGNPSAGTNQTFTLSSDEYFPFVGGYNNGLNANFGQRAFAYPLSGFKALCDTNLPAPVVAKPNTLFDVALWTGTGATNAITGLGFSPDLVWIKKRSAAADHNLVDSVRVGTRPYLLYPNLTNAENTSYTLGVQSLDSAGFTLGTDGDINGSGATYAGWCWDAGTTTASNGSGSITSQVRANASAGFSVVTWTAPSSGSGWTVGHGLGAAPFLMIDKCRSNIGTWTVYHQTQGATKALYLNTTDAVQTSSIYWNDTAPSSTVFTCGTTGWYGAGFTHVTYCFAPVVGYSSMGSYVGNGSSDGPFVYTGFRPRWVMMKSTGVSNWFMHDSARSSYNVARELLFANLSSAEDSSNNYIDMLSNGFKPRFTNTDYNTSGVTYIYIAFAENPFQYARAR